MGPFKPEGIVGNHGDSGDKELRGSWKLCKSDTRNCRPAEAQRGFPGGASGKEPTCQGRRQKRVGFDPQVGKIPWRRK